VRTLPDATCIVWTVAMHSSLLEFPGCTNMSKNILFNPALTSIAALSDAPIEKFPASTIEG